MQSLKKATTRSSAHARNHTVHIIIIVNGLNEELGRHRGRDGNKECVLCGNECESVSHVLWECSAYCNSRADFLLKLQEKLGNGFERFDALDSLGKYLRQRVVGRAF